jgi:thiamine biosynthesis lipoprotein
LRANDLVRAGDAWVGRFAAMASPCEVLVDTDDPAAAAALVSLARDEAERIEAKFSRYRADSVVGRMHAAAGASVNVDAETARLLDYADSLHTLSEGRFDITSGVLRRAWTFDGGSRVPTRDALSALLPLVGWSRVGWDGREFRLPPGMEIDFGGIGKEYAVDRAAVLLEDAKRGAFLVNFGGDLFASGERRGGRPWSVGVDDPENPGGEPLLRLELGRGGLATSGDARRFVLHEGRRLGHPRSADGLAGPRRAALGHRGRADVPRSGFARDAGVAARRGGRPVPRGGRRATLDLLTSGRERGLDLLGHLGRERLDLRVEAGDHLPVGRDQELREVPFDVARET